MDVLNALGEFIGDIFLAMFHVYCWNKLLKKENFIKNRNNYILILITALALNIPSYIFEQPIRLIAVSFLLFLITLFISEKNVKKSLMLVIISQMIIGLSEATFAIILSTQFDNEVVEKIQNSNILFLCINIYISVVSVLIINSAKKLFELFENIVFYVKKREGIMYSIVIIIIMIISTIEGYMDIQITYVLITNTILSIIFVGLIIRATKINSLYNKISSKYQTSINSLKEYEIMIDKYRVNNHENKNEFLTIRNMIKNKDSKTIEYIDKLIDNKIKDNEKIMKQTQKIPEGGLRATIYSKLCVMDKYKIKYNLDIAKDVKTVDLINLDEELILNICKILGVFLDNAIEEVQKLKKKNIDIEIYVMDGKLCIDITNNYNGKIDLNKIDKEKYTTKGKGHGYGLSLVNQIIEENSQYLENEKNINGNKFTQILKIKM